MSHLDMDAALPPLDLSHVPLNFVTMMLQIMSLSDRFTCALVCKAWAQEAAATCSIIFRQRVKYFSCLQRWLENHGDQLEVLQLHKCPDAAVLTALPCPQLKDLLLRGRLGLSGRLWSDIAAATKLTSVWLENVWTDFQQQDVVSALTALPDLEQLTWSSVICGPRYGLSDSMLLHQLTKLTALKVDFVAAADALEHLGLLTRLQDVSLCVIDDWAVASCPGLKELKALTRLELLRNSYDIPPSVSQLTALRQLEFSSATPTALNKLSALTGLTRLCVEYVEDLSPNSPPLQLPGLQHLEVLQGMEATMPMSFLATCTQLRLLALWNISLSGPGSLVASSMLQHLELGDCRFIAADEAADPVSWQQVFPGPGRLPHLTSLQLMELDPHLQHADMEWVVACCSSLQNMHLDIRPNIIASALTSLSGLTSLTLKTANHQQCSSLAQLTRLRELRVDNASEVFAAGLRHLAALEQLTSLRLYNLCWSSDAPKEYTSDELAGPYTYEYVFINEAPVGQPPDVSARLRRLCDMADDGDS